MKVIPLLVALPLLTQLHTEVAAQRVSGTVSARESGEPIASVLVQLIGADSTVLVSSFSNEAGQFTLSVDGCGPSDGFLYVARIGYQAIRAPVQDLPEDCSA